MSSLIKIRLFLQIINEGSKKASNIQARNYVVGFIGKKLGSKPRRNPAPSTWITLKGDGKLFHPSESLVEIPEVCEHKFEEFHGNGLNSCVNIYYRSMSIFPKECGEVILPS